LEPCTALWQIVAVLITGLGLVMRPGSVRMALQAQHAHVAANQQLRVGRPVRRVAIDTTAHARGSVLKNKRPALLRVARMHVSSLCSVLRRPVSEPLCSEWQSMHVTSPSTYRDFRSPNPCSRFRWGILMSKGNCGFRLELPGGVLEPGAQGLKLLNRRTFQPVTQCLSERGH